MLIKLGPTDTDFKGMYVIWSYGPRLGNDYHSQVDLIVETS